MTDIYAALAKEITFSQLDGIGYRLVEDQEQLAINQLVDTIDEQYQLEQLLEKSQPSVPVEYKKRHYLLWTPFRNPSLKQGSRFAHRCEANPVYVSQEINTTLAECAYYRLLFLSGMEQPPEESITTQHSLVSLCYASDKAIALHQPPFNAYQQQLSHPSDYRSSQQLSSQLRQQGVELIEFHSARDPEQGINVALYTPNTIDSEQPLTNEPWLSHTTTQQVSFKTRGRIEHYPAELFYVEGKLPKVEW